MTPHELDMIVALVGGVFGVWAGVVCVGLCFRLIREAVGTRLRGPAPDEVDLALLAEIRALRGAMYALRSEALIARSVVPPALGAGVSGQRDQE